MVDRRRDNDQSGESLRTGDLTSEAQPQRIEKLLQRRILCPPPAATSTARLTCRCPLTSPKSSAIPDTPMPSQDKTCRPLRSRRRDLRRHFVSQHLQPVLQLETI